MKRIKVRTFSGVICEQEVFYVRDGVKDLRNAKPRLRFRDEAEREAHKLGISRRRHARLFNGNFTPQSLYCTLTLDDENEVHEFTEMKRIRDLYVRRLQYAYPNAIIFAYIGRGKNTHRIHMHMVAEGVPEEVIKAQWRYGDIKHVSRLRRHNYYIINGVKTDCGMDWTGLANYLFDHWTQEQGGHRWKQTRTASKPIREKPVAAVRNYGEQRPPKAPSGYMLTEVKTTAYGYMYFKYVLIPLPRADDPREIFSEK